MIVRNSHHSACSDTFPYMSGEDCQLGGFLPGQKIASYSNLEALNLEGTGLSRTIPPVLGTLSNLALLKLGYNELDGSIPMNVASLPNLEHLELNDNLLTSSIPSFSRNGGTDRQGPLKTLDLVRVCDFPTVIELALCSPLVNP